MALVPQVVRDLLAVHDDVVDGDVEKFGQPTLPAAFQRRLGEASPGTGEAAAVFWGDLLISLISELLEQTPGDTERRERLRRIVDLCLRRTQFGQLQELLWQRSLDEITPQAMIAVYRAKAGDYCYGLPWRLGHAFKGGPVSQRERAAHLLETIGAASQIVDDLATGCPALVDEGKDDTAEIQRLRRTLLLVELHRRLPDGHRLRPVLDGTSASVEQALEIREAFVSTGAAKAAAQTANDLANQALAQVDGLGLGEAARTYIADLAHSRVQAALRRLTAG